MSWFTDQPPSGGNSNCATNTAPTRPVDVRVLAEKVYRLMLAEARLELARGGRLLRSGD